MDAPPLLNRICSCCLFVFCCCRRDAEGVALLTQGDICLNVEFPAWQAKLFVQIFCQSSCAHLPKHPEDLKVGKFWVAHVTCPFKRAQCAIIKHPGVQWGGTCCFYRVNIHLKSALTENAALNSLEKHVPNCLENDRMWHQTSIFASPPSSWCVSAEYTLRCVRIQNG